MGLNGSANDQPINTSVPLLDIARGTQPIREEMLAAIADVVDSCAYLHGPPVKTLEKTIADVCQTPHAVSCASGSDAILLALMACEVGPGDEVIVPSFTFFATASAVWRLGAKPVFADIDATTFNIDPTKIEAAITPATRAIIPVHLFGQLAAMEEITALATRHNIHVIEDAAQAIGAARAGQPAGSWGDIGCFSFYPTKNLGGCGDGGVMTARDEGVADRLRLLAGHGMRPRYVHKVVGINSRLDTIQAAILNVKLKHLTSYSKSRQRNADRYGQLFHAAGLDQHITLPTAAPTSDHVWNQYTIRVPNGRRDELRTQLAKVNVGTEVYYPIPLHRQECFESLGYEEGSLPITEQAASEVLSLPIYPELTSNEQQTLVSQIASFYQVASANAA